MISTDFFSKVLCYIIQVIIIMYGKIVYYTQYHVSVVFCKVSKCKNKVKKFSSILHNLS
jgi:hypothetical protein